VVVVLQYVLHPDVEMLNTALGSGEGKDSVQSNNFIAALRGLVYNNKKTAANDGKDSAATSINPGARDRIVVSFVIILSEMFYSPKGHEAFDGHINNFALRNMFGEDKFKTSFTEKLFKSRSSFFIDTSSITREHVKHFTDIFSRIAQYRLECLAATRSMEKHLSTKNTRMYQMAELLLRLIIGRPRTLTHNVYYVLSPRLYDILYEHDFMAHSLKDEDTIRNQEDLENYLVHKFGIKIIAPLVRSDETVRMNVTIMLQRILSLEVPVVNSTMEGAQGIMAGGGKKRKK
jgi:hypothetical protein